MAVTDSAGLAPETVREVARAHEPDRYLAALLAPRPVRTDLIAIAAFAAELSRVGRLVRDPMIGEIRLQWWREALHSPAEARTGNPVMDALASAVHRHNLSVHLLERPIDASVRGLDGTGVHGGRTAAEGESALFAAALGVLGTRASAVSETVCIDAGTAYAAARAPLAIPAIRAEAREALARVRRRIVELEPRALVALLPLAMVEPYLQAQERGDADHSGHLDYVTPLGRVWRIWLAKMRRRL